MSNLMELRLRHKGLNGKPLSQATVAEKLGVSLRSYGEWERGALPETENLLKLADYFNVSTDYILGRSQYLNIGDKEMSEATGLSVKAVEVLRYGTLPEADGVISDTPSWNKKTVSFINRALELVHGKAADIDGARGPIDSIFTLMEDYVCSGGVWMEDETTFKKKEVVSIYREDPNGEPSCFIYPVAELVEERMMQSIHTRLFEMRNNYSK